MKHKISILLLAVGLLFQIPANANQPVKAKDLLEVAPAQNSKQMKMEAMLTARKWTCMDVSKKKMTKKFNFDVGNIFSLTIDKKYSFKNNNYDYSSGTWKLDGKYLYFFYNAKDGTNKMENMKYKILKLNESTLLLKRMDRPKGKLTFK